MTIDNFCPRRILWLVIVRFSPTQITEMKKVFGGTNFAFGVQNVEKPFNLEN
jgi:hypothetical protein